MAGKSRRFTDEERTDRAREIMRLRMTGLRHTDIAPRFGVSAAMTSIELNWFLRERATDEERRAYHAALNDQMDHFSSEEIERRWGRTRRMMSMIMDGATLVQTAQHFGITPGAVSKAINSFERVSPDEVAEYRAVASRHRFGHYRPLHEENNTEVNPKITPESSESFRDHPSRGRSSSTRTHVTNKRDRISDEEFLRSVNEAISNLTRSQDSDMRDREGME